MNDKLVKIVNNLKKKNKKISTMESCTGGGLANSITSIVGASSVIEFSAVTYCNKYKIKMGVSKDVIDKYTVYSMETAREMARSISDFSNSNYGVGITGKLGKKDPFNLSGNDNKVYICIYDKDNDIYHDLSIEVDSSNREKDKLEVLEYTVDYLYKIC